MVAQSQGDIELGSTVLLHGAGAILTRQRQRSLVAADDQDVFDIRDGSQRVHGVGQQTAVQIETFLLREHSSQARFAAL